MGRSELLKALLHLISGTTVAQLINVLTVVAIARFFSVEEVGAASFATSVIAVLGAIITLRLHLAILIPRSVRSSQLISSACASIVLGLSLAIGLILFSLQPVLDSLLSVSVSPLTTILMGVSVLMVGIYNIQSAIADRVGRFGTFATSRILGALAKLFVIVAAGGFALDQGEVIVFSNLVALFVSVAFLRARKISLASLSLFLRGGPRLAKAFFRRHKDYLQYGTPAVLVTELEIAAPILCFAFFYPPEQYGQLAFAYGAMRVGVAMLADGFRRVYFKNSALLVEQPDKWVQFFKRFFLFLAIFLALVFGGLFVAVEQLFALVFGAQWTLAGAVAAVLVPLMFMQVLSDVAQMNYVVAARQGTLLAVKSVTTLGMYLALLMGMFHGVSFEEMLLAFVVLASAARLILVVSASYVVIGAGRRAIPAGA